MDPVTIGLDAVGLGLKLFGGMGASNTASQIAQVSGQNAQLEGQVNAQRQQAMELSARRQQMEMFRNTQRARAQGIASAVQGGAQFGSGLAGGIADTTNQGAFNIAGVNQNLQIGRNIFGLDASISQNNVKLAGLKGQEATQEGMSSLGGGILQSAGAIGNISQSFGSGLSSLGSSIFSSVNSGGMLFQ